MTSFYYRVFVCNFVRISRVFAQVIIISPNWAQECVCLRFNDKLNGNCGRRWTIVLITWCFGTLDLMQLTDGKAREIVHDIVVCVGFAGAVLFNANLFIQALQTNPSDGTTANNQFRIRFERSAWVYLQCHNISIGMFHRNVDWSLAIVGCSVMFCLMLQQ